MAVISGFLTSIFTRSYEFVYTWGYIGLFFVNFLETASFSLSPLPSMFFIFTFGSILNPFLVAIFSAFGTALGSSFSYIFGRGFKDMIERKYEKYLVGTRNKFYKHNSTWWIFFLNLVPFPNAFLGIFCGMIHYDFKKYIVITLISKLIYCIILSYAGYYSVGWVLDLFQLDLNV